MAIADDHPGASRPGTPLPEDGGAGSGLESTSLSPSWDPSPSSRARPAERGRDLHLLGDYVALSLPPHPIHRPRSSSRKQQRLGNRNT